MFLISPLVVLMVPTYKLEDMDIHLTMLLFVVYTLLRPHVSTTNFNNHLAVYILTPSLTHCLMVH